MNLPPGVNVCMTTDNRKVSHAYFVSSAKLQLYAFHDQHKVIIEDERMSGNCTNSPGSECLAEVTTRNVLVNILCL